MIIRIALVLFVALTGVFTTLNGYFNQMGFTTNTEPENLHEVLFSGAYAQTTASGIDQSLIIGIMLLLLSGLFYYVLISSFRNKNEREERRYIIEC